MPIHSRKPTWLNKRHCYTGMPPLSYNTGMKAWSVWNNIMSWRQDLFIGIHCGRPDKTVNGNGDGAFHWCISAADKADTANPNRPIGIIALPWAYDSSNPAGGEFDVSMLWYAPHSTGSPQTIFDHDGYSTAITTATYGDDIYNYSTSAACYTADEDGDPILYSPEDSANDGFLHCKLTYTAAMYASLGLFHVPEELTEAQIIATQSQFDVGSPIRGYDSDAGTSLGLLIHNIGDGSNGDFLEKHTRRYLIHQAHPTGWGMTNTTGFEDVFNGGVWRVRSRNLTEQTSGTVDCLPALVVTCSHAGAEIKLTSANTPDTWTYTCDGTESATMVTASDGTGATGTGLHVEAANDDFVKMEIDTDGNYDCLVHTVCLMDYADF